MCYATRALFTAIAASVRVIMVKSVDGLYLRVAVAKISRRAKIAAPTNCTLAVLLS